MSTQVPPRQAGRAPAPSKVPLRGGVDLGALAAARQAQSAADERARTRAESGDTNPLVFDVTEASFQVDVIDRSMQIPVVVDLWATWCEPCKALSPILERLAQADGGKWALAKIDIDAQQQLGAAFRAQSIPAVFVVMAGQAGPLFQGALPEAEVRRYLDEILKVAAQQGLGGAASPDMATGGVTEAGGTAGALAGAVESQPGHDPRYDAAYDAFDKGDWDAADAAYDAVLAGNPGDSDAKAGKSRVGLMRRTQGCDAATALAAAAAAATPADIAAVSLAADFDLLAGNAVDAFARLIDAVRLTSGAERDALRAHLLELFEVLGQQDPDVIKARSALASALF